MLSAATIFRQTTIYVSGLLAASADELDVIFVH